MTTPEAAPSWTSPPLVQARIWFVHGPLGKKKNGGSTQSRLNLTNHHYKEPQQNSSTRNANNGVVTLILLGRSTSHQGAQHGQVGKIFMQIIGFQ